MTQNLRSDFSLREFTKTLDLDNDNQALISQNGDLRLGAIANAEEAGEDDVIFIANDRYKRKIADSKARLVIGTRSLFSESDQADIQGQNKLLILVPDAKVAMARASEFFEEAHRPQKSSGTFVHAEATVDNTASIGPNAVISEGARIGANTIIHAGVVVGRNVTIGDDCEIFANVVLYENTILHNRVRIHGNSTIGADGFGYAQERTDKGVVHRKIYHHGNVIIHDDVEIGANSSIDRGTVGSTIIHRGCKIDNQVQIGHNCVLEEGVIVCGGCGIAGTVHIGKYALLAGMVGVGDQMKIGAGAVVAGQSGVEANLEPGGVYAGHPIRSKRDFYRMQVMLNKLPEMYAEFKERKKKEKQR